MNTLKLLEVFVRLPLGVAVGGFLGGLLAGLALVGYLELSFTGPID